MLKLNRLVGIAILFMSAFDPQVPGLPNGVGITLLISVLLFPLVASRLLRSDPEIIFYLKKTIPFFILFLASFFIILIRMLLNAGENISFSLSWFKAFVVFLSCLFVFLIFFSKEKPEKFIFSLLLVYLINAAINFLAGTFPDSFGFISMFRAESISDSLGGNPYRNSFISGSGYFSIGTAYGLITLLFSFYLSEAKSRNILAFLSITVIAASGFLAARTAFFAIAGAVVYILKKRPGDLIYLSIFSSSVLYFLGEVPGLQPYISWMQSFFSFAHDASGSHLINQMYFWPGESIFLFGDGSVNDGGFIYTDGGFMQDILFGGILFAFIKLSFLMVFVFCFARKYPLFSILVSISVIAFHVKGLFLYNNAQGMAAFYFIFLFLCLHCRETKRVSLG